MRPGAASSHEPRRHRAGTWVSALVALGALAGVAGCSSVDQERFCNQFPSRSSADQLRLPEHELAADDPAGLTAEVMALSAESLRKNPPEELADAVSTYTEALIAWSPGEDPPGDAPAVRAAVEEIDRWLAERCGPPETFEPMS